MSAPTPVRELRTLVVINERAGAGAMADAFRRFEHALEDAIGNFELAFTDGPGHATIITREALQEGIERIVVGGGDGTINEVVNGFFTADTREIVAQNAVLALMGGGTGGDFRKTAGVRDFETALAALTGGRTLPMDVGRVTHLSDGAARMFCNIASFGFSGEVMRALEGQGSRLVDRYVPVLKALGGQAAHFGATLRAMLDWHNVDVRLEVDGKDLGPQRLVTTAIGNGRYFGGGMMVCPDARLDSGKFEVTILGDLNRFEVLALARTIYTGRHLAHPKVKSLQAASLTAHAVGHKKVRVEIDGELFGELPALFEIVPSAIRLAVL